MSHLCHDSLVGLMCYDVVEIGGSQVVGCCGIFKRYKHLVTCVYKYVASVGHLDAAFFGTEHHAFGAFAYVTESAGEYLLDGNVAVGGLVLRQEVGYCGVTPEMSRFRVAFIGVICIVLRAHEECLCRLSGCEVCFDDFKTVDK